MGFVFWSVLYGRRNNDALILGGIREAFLKRLMRFTLKILILCAAILVTLDALGQTVPRMDQWGERFNSPSARLICKEVGRTPTGGKTVITYNLFAEGLPKDRHFVLWVLNVGSQPQAVADAYLNESGRVVNVLADPQRNILEDPINVRVSGGRGEPINFALISDNDHFHVFTQIVPFPMEKSSGPCNLSVVETGRHYSTVLIKISGLQPNEELAVNQKITLGNGQVVRGSSGVTAAVIQHCIH